MDGWVGTVVQVFRADQSSAARSGSFPARETYHISPIPTLTGLLDAAILSNSTAGGRPGGGKDVLKRAVALAWGFW